MWNKIQLIGRLTREPERKNISSYDLAQFSLAQNKKQKDKDVAMYYDCKGWGKVCERVMKLKKGDLVIVEGRLEQETWSRQDGTRGSKHVINVNAVMVIPKADQISDPSEGNYPGVEVDYSGPAEDIF